MKISLKNIADETGFSISTVSRFLCGKRRYYNEKEKLIFKTANKEKSKQGLYDSDLTTRFASYILCKD